VAAGAGKNAAGRLEQRRAVGYAPRARMPDTPSFRASIALAAYSEPLVDGRRAVVFGDSSS